LAGRDFCFNVMPDFGEFAKKVSHVAFRSPVVRNGSESLHLLLFSTST
jgi:hypothetical protein